MFIKRIEDIREKLHKEKFDAVFVSSVSNITYLTGFSNFSKNEREAYLFIGKNFAYIITDGRYTEAVKKEVPYLTLFERGEGKSTTNLFKKHKKEIKQLGIEEDNLTVSELRILNKHFKITKHFNVGSLRSLKTQEEINKIERACKIGDLAFDFILTKIKIGVSEKRIARDLENFIREKDAGISFPPIIAFGKNSSVPHHQTGDKKLQKGDFVLLDFGVKVYDYCSDMTRTIFFGKPANKQKKIYEAALEAQCKAVDFINTAIKSGNKVLASNVDKVVRDYILSQGYPTIPHSLGHGIGIDVHERPSLSIKSKDELLVGMVFSIEPGIYIPNFGGVRIEDLFVFGKNQLRQITRSSKQIISIDI